ncbi:uncharacterized protein LOC117330008 [Pecten maximus]|uniref:uncharacterized protein LOC117330008 n=1 Tax=Pecten maximus TaxID=6579 RepID=UPI001458201D|nr:uncharacterized protein LOC117330008 [Pecten maximus]
MIARVKQHCRCNRRCEFKKNIKNITMKEVREAIEQTRKELKVETVTLTSFIMKKISMKDTRTSSIGFGIVAITMLVLVLGFLSAGDIIGLVKYFENRRKPTSVKRSVKGKKGRRLGLRKELAINRENIAETKNA